MRRFYSQSVLGSCFCGGRSRFFDELGLILEIIFGVNIVANCSIFTTIIKLLFQTATSCSIWAQQIAGVKLARDKKQYFQLSTLCRCVPHLFSISFKKKPKNKKKSVEKWKTWKCLSNVLFPDVISHSAFVRRSLIWKSAICQFCLFSTFFSVWRHHRHHSKRTPNKMFYSWIEPMTLLKYAFSISCQASFIWESDEQSRLVRLTTPNKKTRPLHFP